ncbi:MAG TPA: MMPL family transporter [Verrucomicrobiae bacterium]|nr:MMPL family transporter [Verrucomicrobiae bacterium]
MLGRHQGLQSLGMVMSMGIAACMIAGLTFLPAMISILGRVGWNVTKKRLGDGNATPPPSTEEPR